MVEARRSLADVLRHDLGYTGTHLGCEHGICGACTVLVDGQAGALVPDVRRPGRRPARSRRSRGSPTNGELQRAAAGVRDASRPAVRLLHARLPHARHRAAARESQIRPTRRSAHAMSVEPVPLHRVAGHPRGRSGRRRRLKPRRSTMATTSAPPTLDPKDVLGLDHLLGDEERMLRDTVRRLVGDRVLPDVGRLVRGGRPSRASWPRRSASSACSACTSRATAAPARAPSPTASPASSSRPATPGVRSFVSVQGSLAMFPIWKFGSEEQKQEWLPRHGRRRGDRLLRPDRARLRLRPGQHAHDAPRATATTGSSTAPRCGSPTAASPTWPSCGRATRRRASAASSSRPTRRASRPRHPPQALAAGVGHAPSWSLDDVRLPGRRRAARGHGHARAALVPQRGALRHLLGRHRRRRAPATRPRSSTPRRACSSGGRSPASSSPSASSST